jgi:[histone H4]-N-methyl-L-lysine20 N-methyltransferase
VCKVYYWTTIRKNRNLYHASRGVREEDIASILQKIVIIGKDAGEAESQLLLLPGLRKFMDSLQSGKEKDDFRKHMRRYVSIYLPDCPFEITSTNRYTVVTHEASVTARKFIKKGETVKYLCGVQVIMTKEEEADINQRRRDFSIVVSSRKKSASLFLGPARFANHDCGANAELMTSGASGMEIIAVRDIEIGDEITVTYGDNYFGEDNCECLCKTCEDNMENGWEQEDDDAARNSAAKPSIEQAPAVIGSYSLRRRRKSDFVGSSRTPSAAPDLRPHVPKGTPKRPNRIAKKPSSPELSPSQQLMESNKKRAWRDESLMAKQNTAQKKQCIRGFIKEECVPTTDLDGLYSTPESSRASSVFESRDGSAQVLSSLDSNLTDTTSVDEDTIIVRPMRKKSLSPLCKNACEPATPTGTGTDKFSSNAAITMAAFADGNGASMASIARLGTNDSDALEPRTSRKLKRPSMKLLTKTLASTTKKRKYNKKKAPAVTDIDHAPEIRKPGDYVLTSLLLAQPASAWISCKICDEYFVQLDAYLTRSSCPRCERHSKLYGYQWPKTDKEGRNDTEERILDHRTIHRFIRPDEERAIRRRGKSYGSTASPEVFNVSVESEGDIMDDTQGRPRSQRLRMKRERLTL